MYIFDGLHPQCADSIDMEKSDSSEDSDMEVIEQLVVLMSLGLQMVAARAQAVPEPDPVCNLPAAKRQATITSYFRK